MFKFKMSLLLKSTKFRVSVAILAIAATIAGIVLIPINRASTLGGTKSLNEGGTSGQTVGVVANPSGVTVGNGIVYVIERSPLKPGTASGFNNLYCIQADQDLVYKEYTEFVDISSGSSYFSNYDRAVWIINNMYIQNTSGGEQAKNVMITNLANLLTSDSIKTKVNELGFDGTNITAQNIINLKDRRIGNNQYTKNALEVVEQIALWKYTNNKGTTLLSAYNNVNQYFENSNLSQDEQRILKYVYYALGVAAETNSNTASSNSITLNKNDAKFDESTYKVGPYFLESNGAKLTDYNFGENSQYQIEVTITNKDDSTIKVGKEVIEKNNDGSFNINLESYKEAKKVEFQITGISTISTTATIMKGEESQNLISIDKTITPASVGDSKEIKVTQQGQYNIVLKKVKEDGTTVITSSEATFKINGIEDTTQKGILDISKGGKSIENEKQEDVYEIVEEHAPEGYTASNNTMKVNVKFKKQGDSYVIDRDNTTTDGFTNGSRIYIDDNNLNITIYVVNKEEQTPGKYSVIIKKVDASNENTTLKGAYFNVNGTKVGPTDENGEIIVASNEISKENQIDEYTIKETDAPENYQLYDGEIKVTIPTKFNGSTYEIDDKNVKVSGKVLKYYTNADKTTITFVIPNVQEKSEFDLALRKFITKIDDKEVTPSRIPVVNEQSIINLQRTGTASYYHTKQSIGVTVGSEIEYTIRIYNEDVKMGYAKQITDYLPEGLSFVKIADESASQYSTESKAGSKVVVINYNGNSVIQTLRNFIGKGEVNVTSEYYQEVKIICKVESTSAKYITSRAEITNYGYYETDSEGNAIWHEAKTTGVDKDSVQNTIKNALKLDTWYETAKEREYTDESGKTIVDKYYYPGEEDDDDFETVELYAGKYSVIIKKVDANDENTTLKGAYFNVNGTKVGPTDEKGEVIIANNIEISKDNQVGEYIIKETEAPENYQLYDGEIKVTIPTKLNGSTYEIDDKNVKVSGKVLKYYTNADKTTITFVIPNVPEKREFDLALRKFITDVNGEKLVESREPQVDSSKLASGDAQTATYTHSKTPVDVNTSDVVTYTLRVYNEGEVDGYAKKIMDDIPEGLEFLPDNDVNKTYKWIMYKEDSNVKENEKDAIFYNGKGYKVTTNASEADLIVTEYLSKENGENNLLKAFDSKVGKMTEDNWRDIKASFKVVEPKTSDRIITNYAQITEHTDSKGNTVTDRDSTPNEWKEGEDDQDIEKIKVRYFDLALKKWVTKAIVYEDGYERITETNHSPLDNPEPILKVDLKNTSLNNVEVKFEYSIRVYNQSKEIAGYAKEISDYIPEGLKFVATDNPDWKEVDGKVVTRALENTLLQPGEYADVKIVLTWINGSDNLGVKTNTAEISEDYNEFGTPDKDSIPNNKVPGEDDIDEAKVILAIRTGEAIVYTGIALVAFAILSLGVVIIRKKVLA